MPGPAWYAQAVFDEMLHIPAGQITAAKPLQWESETPVTTGQVGGGPWIISRHSTNLKGAADFIIWATTVFNPTGADTRPAIRPTGPWPQSAGGTGHQPVLRGRSPPGAQGGRQPDLVRLAPRHISGSARLVQHRGHPAGRWKLAEFLAQPLGDALAQPAQASGYEVVRQ